MAKTGTPSIESILKTVIDAIIAIDENGVMQSANPAVQKIFGYKPDELIGRNVSMLMPDPYAAAHNGYIKEYLRTGQAKIIGIGREAVGKKKDGTIFPIYLGVSEGRREGNRRFFTGVIRDVTDVRRYQDELKKQGDFTKAILNTVRSLVIVLDRKGRIVNVNRACEETTGYAFDEVAGKPFWDFFLRPEDRDLVTEHFLSAEPRQLVNNFEAVWLTKNKEKRLIAWSNSMLAGNDREPAFIIGTGIDITDRRNLERLVLEITKKEKERLGQELHDGLAQHLASTAIAAKVVERKLAKQSVPAARELKRVIGMVNQAVAQTRELAQGLYALEAHSEDLASSLKKLAKDTQKSLGVRCQVEIEGNAQILGQEAAAHLYRIAREAVTNAVRHGRGKNIKIRLRKKNARESELTVENDGKRFLGPADRNGLGLRIMKSRAAILSGSLDVSPGPKGGAVVHCVFPTAP